MTPLIKIQSWLEAANSDTTHVVIVTDTFDYSTSPLYVKEGQDVREVINDINSKNMQRVEEVYSMKLDIQFQLKEQKSWNV